jgi:hypothetical protein
MAIEPIGDIAALTSSGGGGGGGGTTIDDFEDGNISEYGGDTASFSVQTNTVWEGTHALSGQRDMGGQSIASTSGLDNYPTQDKKFTFYHQGNNESDSGIGFFVQSETSYPDGYYLEHSTIKNEIVINLRDNGNSYQLSSTNVSQSTNTWYKGECLPESDGTITCTLYDTAGNELAQVSATDSTFSSGGISFIAKGNSGAVHYWDNLLIE